MNVFLFYFWFANKTTTTTMEQLPMDTVNIVLLYAGYHTFRNGKFMSKIPKTDERYRMLSEMARPVNCEYVACRKYVFLYIDETKWLVLKRDIGMVRNVATAVIDFCYKAEFKNTMNENQIKNVKKRGYFDMMDLMLYA